MGWTGLPGPLFPWLFTGADLFCLCPVFSPRASLRAEGMAKGGTFFWQVSIAQLKETRPAFVPGLQSAPRPDGLVPGPSVLPLV